MNNPFLQAAQAYHQLGYHPIPCAPRDKRPLVSWKDFQTTMPTPDQVQSWWRTWPDANVALVLGRGRFAVDLDGGLEAEQLLANAGIALPADAPRSQTGGGFHVFLSAFNPVPDRVGLLTTEGHKPQVDIRGVGIVVAPPSIHPNGATYQWLMPLVAHPPRAPLALMDLIGKTQNTPRSEAQTGSRFWVADALRGVGEGQRDQVCTKLAGYFLQKGLDAETVTTLLIESYGKACTPAFTPRDVEKCVQSIAKREDAADRTIHAQHMETLLADFMEALRRGPAPTLATPFPTLNHFLSGGFGPGELIFLGARPGVGKTALGLEVARTAATRGAGAVIVVSREMTNLALTRRLVAQDARIRATTLKRGTLSDVDRFHLTESVERLRRLPLWFTDEAVSLGEIHTLVNEITSEAPLALLVVDYLQLVKAPRDIKERRHQVEAISQGLKGIALSFKVPVLCLSSLSRGQSDDRNKPPTLASLRESGELEHDADVILLLHRDYHDAMTICKIAKNRDGRLGEVKLNFREEYVAFDEVADQEMN